MNQSHSLPPLVQLVLGLGVTAMTTFIGIRALRRGRIVVGRDPFVRYVNRNIQPVRFWVALGGNAAFGALGVYYLGLGILAFYANGNG